MLEYFADSGIDVEHFCDEDKLRTFIQLNRFLLVSRKMEEKSKTKQSKPEGKKSKLEIENSEISNLVKAGEHVLVQEDIK